MYAIAECRTTTPIIAPARNASMADDRLELAATEGGAEAGACGSTRRTRALAARDVQSPAAVPLDFTTVLLHDSPRLENSALI
jgi:hypothetical protein